MSKMERLRRLESEVEKGSLRVSESETGRINGRWSSSKIRASKKSRMPQFAEIIDQSVTSHSQTVATIKKGNKKKA